jgi:Angiotensin-converting enzyme
MRSSPVVAAAVLAACAPAAAQQAPPPDPKQFVAKVNEDLKRLFVESSTADWIKSAYSTDDTERSADWKPIPAHLLGNMWAQELLEYFRPLQGWLRRQNQGKQCGW